MKISDLIPLFRRAGGKKRRKKAPEDPIEFAALHEPDVNSIPDFYLRKRNSKRLYYVGEQNDLGGNVIKLTRSDLLKVVCGAVGATLVIDWASIHRSGRRDGEWGTLWRPDDMRLTKLVMDMCVLARRRDWRVLVVGPLRTSSAPMFATVRDLVDEIDEAKALELIAEAQ